MYLSIEKSITKRWSNNNITSYYKAYAECGTKLDYDGSDKGLSYETALSYAVVENIKRLEIEGLEGNKEIDWGSVRTYLKKHYSKSTVNELMPIIEQFELNNVSTWDKFCENLKNIDWSYVVLVIIVIFIIAVIAALELSGFGIIASIATFLGKVLQFIF